VRRIMHVSQSSPAVDGGEGHSQFAVVGNRHEGSRSYDLLRLMNRSQRASGKEQSIAPRAIQSSGTLRFSNPVFV
jgi:hypothetical protein